MNTQADAQFILEWVGEAPGTILGTVAGLIPMGEYSTETEATAATASCWKELITQCSSFDEKISIANGHLCMVRKDVYGKSGLISKFQIPDDQWLELCSLENN